MNTSLLATPGSSPEITFQGKVYRIGHPTQRARETLERLAAAKATLEITALKGELDATAYAELFESHKQDIVAGKYRAWGEGWQRITLAPRNHHLFLLALLRENHPDATEREALGLAQGAREEVELALAEVVPGFFTLLVEEMPLPPQQKQAARQTMEAALRRLMHAA